MAKLFLQDMDRPHLIYPFMVIFMFLVHFDVNMLPLDSLRAWGAQRIFNSAGVCTNSPRSFSRLSTSERMVQKQSFKAVCRVVTVFTI